MDRDFRALDLAELIRLAEEREAHEATLSIREWANSSNPAVRCSACDTPLTNVIFGRHTSLSAHDHQAVGAGAVILCRKYWRGMPHRVCLLCQPLWRDIHAVSTQIVELQVEIEAAISKEGFTRACSIFAQQQTLREQLDALATRLMTLDPR